MSPIDGQIDPFSNMQAGAWKGNIMFWHKRTGEQGGSLRRKLKRLVADKRGVAAVEFAFIAPLLFIMYFLTLEVSLGIESNKKVGRIGSMVADLITQQQT